MRKFLNCVRDNVGMIIVCILILIMACSSVWWWNMIFSVAM